jgi:hypothetical protein
MFALVMPEIHRHTDTKELERYSQGNIPQSEADRIEEHLLPCESCRHQLEETELYIASMRRASEELELQPEKRSWWRRNVPVLTLAACAIMMLLVALPWNSKEQPPVGVNLIAVRADASQVAPAGKPLWLHPDLTGIIPALSSHLEVVNRDGGPVWGGVTAPPEAGARMPSQRSGTYFIRLYTRSKRAASRIRPRNQIAHRGQCSSFPPM